MHIQNSYTFDAPPKAVWDLLVDIDAVAACLPGCESMEPISENKYRAVLTMGIAANTGRYAARSRSGISIHRTPTG